MCIEYAPKANELMEVGGVYAGALVSIQIHGCYNRVAAIRFRWCAVVPLQTHGCYNEEGLQ